MGEYHIAVNIDRREFINPHAFGNGAKFIEFHYQGFGLMAGLGILLVEPGKGHYGENTVSGSWARDRIVIAGDHAPHEPGESRNLIHIAYDEYKDISSEVVDLMKGDEWVRARMSQKFRNEKGD